MTDIRMIDIKKNGEIVITPDLFHLPLTERESAIQYVVTTLLMTPGTNVEDPAFGGGIFLVLNSMRSSFSQTEQRVSEIVHTANLSLESHRPDFGDYTIEKINLKDVENLSPRSFRMIVSITFTSSTEESFTIPGAINA